MVLPVATRKFSNKIKLKKQYFNQNNNDIMKLHIPFKYSALDAYSNMILPIKIS